MQKMIKGRLITDCDNRPNDGYYYEDGFSNGPYDLYGNFPTWPLERHQEFMAFPTDEYCWNRFKILIDNKLDIYYKDHKIINCRELVNFYQIDGIDCEECDCRGINHNENCKCDCFNNDPDGEDQAQHRFYMYVTDGLSFGDCSTYINGNYESPVLNNSLKIGDLHITHAHVHIKIPYHKIKLPFIPHKVPIAKSISYLMNNIYNRQIYTLILCFKHLGYFPSDFLKELKWYLIN